MLGDFGGFVDAVYLLLSVPIGWYAKKMFEREVAMTYRLEGGKKRGRGDKRRNKLPKLDNALLGLN